MIRRMNEMKKYKENKIIPRGFYVYSGLFPFPLNKKDYSINLEIDFEKELDEVLQYDEKKEKIAKRITDEDGATETLVKVFTSHYESNLYYPSLNVSVSEEEKVLLSKAFNLISSTNKINGFLVDDPIFVFLFLIANERYKSNKKANKLVSMVKELIDDDISMRDIDPGELLNLFRSFHFSLLKFSEYQDHEFNFTVNNTIIRQKLIEIFADNMNYEKLEEFKDINNKNRTKMIRKLADINDMSNLDYQFRETVNLITDSDLSRYHKNLKARGFYTLLNYISYKQLSEIIRNLINRKALADRDYNYKLDLHDFLINLNNRFFDRVYEHRDESGGDNPYVEDLIRFLKLTKNSQSLTVKKILQYYNYERVRTKETLEQVETEIEIIEGAINTYQQSFYTLNNEDFFMGESSLTITPSNMLFNNDFVLEEVHSDKNKINKGEIYFTKKHDIINSVGRRTMCCFTPNGLASKLLKIAKLSPLAGIIEGTTMRNKTWFSYVWEMQSLLSNGIVKTSLILDNIESNSILEQGEFKDIVKTIQHKSSYDKTYLGYLRNDVSDVYSLFNGTIDKPNTIYGFAAELRSYNNYDDSRKLFDVNEISDNSDKYKELTVQRIDSLGDFHRALSAEKVIWESNSDNDLKNLPYTIVPSYIIKANNGDILGYMFNHIITASKQRILLNQVDLPSRIPTKFNFSEEQEMILVIDDIYLVNNRHVLSCFKEIEKDLVNFIKENEIKYISASANVYSSPMLKRIERYEGVTFIEDNRFGSRPEDRPTITSSRELIDSKDIFKDDFEVKVNIDFDNVVKLKDLYKEEKDETENVES